MGIFSRNSDSDLQQSMDLASEIAEEARRVGDKKREAAAHRDLNEQIDEAEKRGWFRR